MEPIVAQDPIVNQCPRLHSYNCVFPTIKRYANIKLFMLQFEFAKPKSFTKALSLSCEFVVEKSVLERN